MEAKRLNIDQSWDVRKESFKLIPVHKNTHLLDGCSILIAQAFYNEAFSIDAKDA